MGRNYRPNPLKNSLYAANFVSVKKKKKIFKLLSLNLSISNPQGADIILFPEYGLFAAGLDRKEQKRYLEVVPDPKQVNVSPCDEPKTFKDRQILYSLSCMAKNNGIVVVANMGSIEKCEEENGCPEDGALQLNTNVAFDEKGTLIARHHKEHLFFEKGLDLPREKQDPIFETPFGKFATFICFDIIFGEMTMVSQDVDAILFSTQWWNTAPFYTSTQWWQAWATGNNATIIAANRQIPGYFSTGSGMYRRHKGSVAHTLNPDGISKLVVARIPKRRNEGISSATVTAILKNSIVEEWKDDGRDVPEVCSYAVLGLSKNIYQDYRCVNEKVDNYTLVKLHKAEDHLQVCNNNMCCELDYVANGMNESYYLGVYNGTNSPFTTGRYFWWEENCFLARCDDLNDTACVNFPTVSKETLFYTISMKATFSTDHVYPGFVSNKMRLVPVEMWTFKKGTDWSSIAMNSWSGVPVTAATLKGRVYERDPPYIR